MMKFVLVATSFLCLSVWSCSSGDLSVDIAGGDVPEVFGDSAQPDDLLSSDVAQEIDSVSEDADSADVSWDVDASSEDTAGDADIQNVDVPFDEAGDVNTDAVDDTYLPGEWPDGSSGAGFRRYRSFIVDDRARVVLLHGVNVSNYAKYSPDLLPWHTAENFRQLAAAGFDSIRLQTYWAAIVPTEGVIDQVYLGKYADLVDAAGQAGLNVIVDMHQDIFGVGFYEDGAPRWACDEQHYIDYVPTEPWSMNYLSKEVQACFDNFYSNDATFERFVGAWVAVAESVGGNPAVIGFDLLNEPNWGTADAGTFTRDIWLPRMEQIAEALEIVAPGRMIFMEPTTLAITLGVPEQVRVTTEPDAVFAPHFYHPSVHEGAAYERASNYDLVELAVSAMATSAEGLGGLPVWVGEFGGPWNADAFDQYMGDILMNIYRINAGWAVYSDDLTNNDGFGIRNADGAFKEDAVRILGHPRAVRVPGPVLSQELDRDLKSYSLRFKWFVSDAELELWGGYPDGQLPLGPCVHVEGSDECATCVRREERPDGLWSCEKSVTADADAVWEVAMLPATL